MRSSRLKTSAHKVGMAGAAGLVAVLSLGAFAGAASATASGGTAASVAPATGSSTLYDGETGVAVTAPASTFDASTSLTIWECSASTPANTATNGTSTCDSLTGISGATSAADGSLNFQPSAGNSRHPVSGYKLFSLPSSRLGESSDAAGVCNATTACVLFVGEDPNNLSLPYTFTAPFFIQPNPSQSVPETPLAIYLPLAAVGLLGGAYVLHRSRRRPGMSAAA